MEIEPEKKVIGPTPNGGDYAIMYTHDDFVEIVEFNKQDEPVFRTYGSKS